MHTIENDILKVSVNTRGAELSGIYHKSLELEYMWNADPAFWAKQSPILFPVVGGLKNNTYFFDNRSYELPRHGFAREHNFSVAERSADRIKFRLFSNEETLQCYPFQFELDITYELRDNMLAVTYDVTNPAEHELYFSIGGHPAFKVPLVENTNYDDYYLEFNARESSKRWAVSPDGLIDDQPMEVFHDDSIIMLKKELFAHDALVFKDLKSTQVALKCAKHTHGLDFDFTGFPFLGIWAAKNADFVCIEPWCGIADSVHTDQQLKHKEGIIRLGPEDTFHREWKVAVW